MANKFSIKFCKTYLFRWQTPGNCCPRIHRRWGTDYPPWWQSSSIGSWAFGWSYHPNVVDWPHCYYCWYHGQL